MKRTPQITSATRFSELPKNYSALCAIHMPRTPHDDIELENVTEIMNLMVGHKLTEDQADYLSTLATLVLDFEDQNVASLRKLAPH